MKMTFMNNLLDDLEKRIMKNIEESLYNPVPVLDENDLEERIIKNFEEAVYNRNHRFILMDIRPGIVVKSYEYSPIMLSCVSEEDKGKMMCDGVVKKINETAKKEECYIHNQIDFRELWIDDAIERLLIGRSKKNEQV